eukprot:CAMPEP_0116873568 /NCGR_PEP_ID=MMETSP0463-20121206/4792_1 /TAXON_ID=181622 /ORGANISM="Strombidinopsis sp, Strain SopsisLIS2011" /LENGTH=77 /DNA_ID=CAMNT_0004515867 /DNA_START=1111 /DNA_END=1344 /DNA_ORIENTATION=-
MTLNEVIKLGVALLTDVVKHTEQTDAECIMQISEHEKALFMIDEVFIRNRVRSLLFMAEVESVIDIKKESLNDLALT